MNRIDALIGYLDSLDERAYRNHLVGTAAIVLIVIVGSLYAIRTMSLSLTEKIERLQGQSRIVHNLERDLVNILEQKKRILNAIDDSKEFDIKAFFETFYRTQGIRPEAGWSAPLAPATLSNNPDLEEVAITALCKGITMQTLTETLGALEKEPRVYTKSMVISRDEGGKSISVEITLGSLRRKNAQQQPKGVI